ncbi:hypothetical protein [Spirosoma aerophilum]
MTTYSYSFPVFAEESLPRYPKREEFEDSLAIQYVDLHGNQLLFSEVQKYIREQRDSSSLFRSGYGYVTIGGIILDHIGQPVLADSLENHLKDISLKFNIGLSSFYPQQNMGKPLYYSFVDDRLILIFEQNAKWIHHNTFSVSSIIKVKKLIKQALKLSFDSNFEFKDTLGDSFFLSVERREKMSQEEILEMGSYSLQKLKTVTVYFDGSIDYQYFHIGKVR